MEADCNHEGTKTRTAMQRRNRKPPSFFSSSCLRAFVVNMLCMAQTKHEIQSLLAGAGTEPRHRFGQNFMIDQNLVRLVADVGLIEPGELIIEVGPGTGTLTEELLARGAELLAVG